MGAGLSCPFEKEGTMMRKITEAEFEALLQSDGWTHEQGYQVFARRDDDGCEVDGEVEVLFTLYSTLGDIRITHEEPALFVRGDSTAYSFDAKDLGGAWPFETKVEGVEIIDEYGRPSGLQGSGELTDALPEEFISIDYARDYAGIVAEAEEKGYF